jgi:hypothetical protein
MADQDKKPVTCPIEILGISTLCDNPGLARLLKRLGLSADQIETLHVHLHVFRHKILAAGYEFYEKVPRQPVGEPVLQFLLTAWSDSLRDQQDRAKGESSSPPPPPRR